MPILLNTPIQTGACVPPHRLRIPRHPFVPPYIVPMQWHPLPHAFVKHSQQRIANSFDPQPVTNLFPASTIYTSVHTPVPPWSPLRLDVSAPTFPSYFSSGFFPFSIYYRSRADPGFLPDLSIGVVHGHLSHGAMRFPRLCPFLSISLSVLLPLPSSGLSPAPRLST